jgi:Ni,Fe-hydrogenase I large subunit
MLARNLQHNSKLHITDKMKKNYFLVFIAILSMQNTDAQILKNAKKFINSGSKGLTEKDAADGIKEALVNGTSESVKLVSIVNGYWGNPEIKIPFPPEAKEMESKLRTIGMGKKVDEFNESMNRAAEKAANEAKPIFIAAIKGMTVKDAINIVKGSNNAATMYLKNTTSPELKNKFQPIIKTSLDNVNATKYWSDLITAYNKIPLVKKMNPNLTEYVTDKAINGLFIMIAREELKIRKDPMARTSELLKKVFGN